LLSPYLLQEADDFSYQFTSDEVITYHLYFLDYSYMFDEYPHLAKNVYSFNIDVITGDTALTGEDERIGLTIVQVFSIFFTRQKNVAIYVCDSADERHIARKRKFDFWFWKYNDGSIIKEDGIAMVENMEILNSLLVHRNNPHCTEILFAFKDLNARVGDK
jgi:Family of unknown function (DUF6169)